MKLKAIEFAQAKIDKQGKVQDIAGQIKRHFDDNFNAHWQCVVGKEFGSDIGYEENYCIYFFIGRVAVLLWKAGWT